MVAHGTSFLGTEKHPVVWLAIAAFVGTGAYVFPLSTSWFVVLILMALASGIALSPKGPLRIVWAAAGTVATALALNGTVSPSLVAASLAAGALSSFSFRRPGLAIAILLMQVSSAATVQELFSDFIFQFGLEPSGPALVAVICLWSIRLRAIAPILASLLIISGVAWVGIAIPLSPVWALALTGLPAAGLAAVFTAKEGTRSDNFKMPLAILLIAVATWIWTPPKSHEGIYVLLPDASENYEAKFFSNYIEALRFGGIKVQVIKEPTDVPEGALLFLPWITAPLKGYEAMVGKLARKRGWTVLFGGEHTDMGKAAERVERIVGFPIMRRDLTTPPGNSDISGRLRSTGITAWPFDAILNRGASVTAFRPLQKVLLSGDGWWAEPDVGEWLWAGDYVWQPGDRRGRLALALAADVDGARFVVVGDNSPFINHQLVADPRPAMRLLNLASLLPTFVGDIFLLLLGLLASTGGMTGRIGMLPALSPIVLLALAILVISISPSPSERWREVYNGETGFDERNFNVALTEEPRLWQSNWMLRRVSEPARGQITLHGGKEVIFQLVDKEAHFGNVRLYDCRRLGSLKTDEGPTLMDAQACAVKGDAKVLLGTRDAAAVVAINEEHRRVILVLDVAFLAANAPKANREWLIDQLAEPSKKK